MAEIVRQADVLRKIIAWLKDEFKYPVYAEEVRERFCRPCFFIRANSVMTPKTGNWMQKELTITLLFYAALGSRNEITYMDVVDRIQQQFSVGIYAGERYLKIGSVEDDRTGEADDILEITITIPYLEQTGKKQDTEELMEEINVRTTNKNEDLIYETVKEVKEEE